MPGPEMDLKRELTEAGNRLLRPPDDVDELLALLDRVEHSLSFVEQQPVVGIQDALCPTFKALISTQLLKHPDTDVRVGVAACITEISRITAPDVPYNDDVMKEVFRLTISAFEGLSDNSSKSFSKRLSILEIVARVRSCAVLLDLECNDLVVEMFQIFCKCIRDFHSAIVFASMESIMTLIIEDSEEISADILFALLSVLRKNNKDALPIARKLVEKVVQNCASILKPCIVEAIKSLKINLLDYDFVVTMACQMTHDNNPLKDNILTVSLVNGSESAAVVKDIVQEVVAGSNCNTEVVEHATIEMLNISNKAHSIDVVRSADVMQDQIQSDAPTSDKAINPSEPKSEKIAKKRGRKPKVPKEIIMKTDSGKLPQPDSNKESSEVNTHIESLKAPLEDSSVKPNILENKSVSNNKIWTPKAVLNDAVTLGTPRSRSLPGKSSSKRIRKSKQAMSTHEKTSAHRHAENEAHDELDDTETRPVCQQKDVPDGVVEMASKQVSLVEVKKELDNESESEDAPRKQSSLQLGVTDGTPRMKKRGRPRKDASIAVATGVTDKVSSEGTSKKRSKHSTPPEDGKQYGEELVGRRIEVWWPHDKKYYNGIVESFDPVKKKHKILYTDNEREVLNLHKQKWKLATSTEGFEKNGEACHTNVGDNSDTQQNKRFKMDTESVGKMRDTGIPPKRRGRPLRSASSLACNTSAGKGTKPDGKTIDSMADSGNPDKSMESLSNAFPNLNDLFEDSELEKEVPGNDSTQACVVDTVAPTDATVGIDVNETLVQGGNENPNLNETATTPNTGHSDVNVTGQVKSDPSGRAKTEGLNKEFLDFDTAKKPRKRKAKTSSKSSSPAVLGSTDTVKRPRGRPLRLSLGTSDEKSKLLTKQLHDPQVEESMNGGHSDNLVVVNSEESLAEGRNESNMNAELKVSKHGVLDKNVTKSKDFVMIETKVDVTLEQISCKSASGEPESSSSTRLKLKVKTSDVEPNLRMKKARKNISSSLEQVKKDGSVKRSRGRPCKPKIGDPKSVISPENGSGSTVFKVATPNVCIVPNDSVRADVVMKDNQGSSVFAKAVDLKLGWATGSKGDDAGEKPPESEAPKENMKTSCSYKDQ